MRTAPVLVVLAACANARLPSTDVFPAAGVAAVTADVDRGSVAIAGTRPTEFQVTTERWGRGLTRGMAESQAGRTIATAAVEGGRLALVGETNAPNSGVDFLVEGPPDLDVDALLLAGDLHLEDLEGTMIASAESIYGRGLVGSVDFTSELTGIDLAMEPRAGDTIRLDAVGDTVLVLPYGGDYDLEVFPDPDMVSEVSDLGFDTLTVAPDYVRGRRGSASIEVSVVVRSGSFTLASPETAPTAGTP